MTLREIGESLGLTRERIRQLEKQAMQQLTELGLNPGDSLGKPTRDDITNHAHVIEGEGEGEAAELLKRRFQTSNKARAIAKAAGPRTTPETPNTASPLETRSERALHASASARRPAWRREGCRWRSR